MDLPSRGGRGAGTRANGSFPKGARPLSEKSPAGYPLTAPSGGHPPGARASRPHPVPWVAAQFPCDAATGHPPHRPVRSRAMALLPVNPARGDAEAAPGFCAGGTPALPGGLHPMTSSHQRRSIGLSVYSCSFVVRLHQRSAVFPRNDPNGRAGTKLTSDSVTYASYNPSRRVNQAKNSPAGSRVDTPTTQARRARPVLFRVSKASSTWQAPIPNVATVPAAAPWAHQGQSGGPSRKILQ